MELLPQYSLKTSHLANCCNQLCSLQSLCEFRISGCEGSMRGPRRGPNEQATRCNEPDQKSEAKTQSGGSKISRAKALLESCCTCRNMSSQTLPGSWSPPSAPQLVCRVYQGPRLAGCAVGWDTARPLNNFSSETTKMQNSSPLTTCFRQR